MKRSKTDLEIVMLCSYRTRKSPQFFKKCCKGTLKQAKTNTSHLQIHPRLNTLPLGDTYHHTTPIRRNYPYDARNATSSGWHVSPPPGWTRQSDRAGALCRRSGVARHALCAPGSQPVWPCTYFEQRYVGCLVRARRRGWF